MNDNQNNNSNPATNPQTAADNANLQLGDAFLNSDSNQNAGAIDNAAMPATAPNQSSAAVPSAEMPTTPPWLSPTASTNEDINDFIVPLAGQDAVDNAKTASAPEPTTGSTTVTETNSNPDFSGFTEATPIIPESSSTDSETSAQQAPAIIPWGLETNQNQTISNTDVVPQSPNDVTPEMMADFFSQNQLDTSLINNNADFAFNSGTSSAGLVAAAATTLPTQAENQSKPPENSNPKTKKSSGSWIPVVILLVMIFVVIFVIYLLLNSEGYQQSLNPNNQNQTTSQNSNSDSASSTTSEQNTETNSSESAASAENTNSASTQSAENQSSTETSTQSTAFSFTPIVPAGWVSFSDGFMGVSFALPPQDGYIETQVNTTPQTVTEQIKTEWLSKPAEWFYAPSALTSFFGTDVNAKTLVLNRAPGRASGIGSICPASETYCHIDISLKLSILSFPDSIAELVAKVRAANPSLSITTSVSGQVWGVNSVLMNIDYASTANPSRRNFSLIKIGNNVYVIERFTKSENLLVEFSSVLNAIKIN